MNTASPETTSNQAADGIQDAASSWKMEVHQRLAASRARRRTPAESQLASASSNSSTHQSGSAGTRASLAAAVAARYSGLPSYSQVLAQEAEDAAQAAEDAAQHAREAAAAVLAQMENDRARELAERERRDAEAREAVRLAEQPAVRLALDPRTEQRMAQHMAALEARNSPRELAARPPEFTPSVPVLTDPVEEVLVTPTVPLAANLIEFPRELVAARKARPRLAEGPLRDSHEASDARSHDASELRIYEVHPELHPEVHSGQLHSGEVPVRATDSPQTPSLGVHSEPAASAAMSAHSSAQHRHAQAHPTQSRNSSAEWSAIRLDSGQPVRAQQHPHGKTLAAPLKTASMEDRIMAALVDVALVTAGFLLFVLVFCACTQHPPTGKTALVGGATVLLGLFVLYQLLFFSFAESTPGMSYAHIALCTFDDNNPTRKAMRHRVGALLLSALPVGLGLLWAVFDEDRLGWHDRISGMYQRSYR